MNSRDTFSQVPPAVDRTIIEDVRNGTASFGETYRGGGSGIINSQKTVGGRPELRSAGPPVDTDLDGMPDSWEQRYCLDSNDAFDGPEDTDCDGYQPGRIPQLQRPTTSQAVTDGHRWWLTSTAYRFACGA